MAKESTVLLLVKVLELALFIGASAPAIMNRARETARLFREYRERGEEIPESVFEELIALDKELSAKIAGG